MTALCSGGVSGPKTGVAETVIFTTSSLASVLNNRGGAWATLIAPLLGVVAYQATELCEVDPPAAPAMTSTDYLALLRLDNLETFGTALGKLADLAKIAIWYELCECKTIATPAPEADVFFPPSGIGQPPAIRSTPCWSKSSVELGTYWPGGGAGLPAASYRNHLLPENGTLFINLSAPHEDFNAVKLDPAWTKFRVTARVGDTYTTGNNCQTDVFVYGTATAQNGFGTAIGSRIDNIAGGSVQAQAIVEGSIGAGHTGVTVQVIQLGYSVPQPVEVTVDIFCGDTSPVEAACVQDASLAPLLQQLLELVTLIQRQHVPFAYVPGLEYTGRTGNGEITFTDPILRLQVELTTLPGHFGMAEGNPDALFDVGFISLGTADGFERAHRITTSPFLLQVPGDVTKIGHSLSPGVVATIRTYSREP